MYFYYGGNNHRGKMYVTNPHNNLLVGAMHTNGQLLIHDKIIFYIITVIMQISVQH